MSLSKAALLHRKPAFSKISCDLCCAQGHVYFSYYDKAREYKKEKKETEHCDSVAGLLQHTQ